MKRPAAFVLMIALTFTGVAAPSHSGGASYAHAATATQPPSALAPACTRACSSLQGISFKGSPTVAIVAGKGKKLELATGDEAVVWSADNPAVATVSQTGYLTARRAGVSRITATNPRTNRSATCTVKVYEKFTEKHARKAVLALRKTYCPGKRWTNADYYYWQAANRHCFGCIAFAGIASDAAFGKFAPLKRHARFSKIKAGDHVRIGGRHSAVVLYKRKRAIVVAEGNYNRTFNWGRTITLPELKRQGFYVETRY